LSEDSNNSKKKNHDLGKLKSKRGSGKKYLSYLIYLVPIALILLSYGVIVVATGESEPFTIVSGPSMQPTILSGSIEMIAKTPFDKLQVGDVIVFTPLEALLSPETCQSGAPPTLVTDANIPCFVIHRIVNISTNSRGERIVQTRGDNNQYSICGPAGSVLVIDCDINSTMYVGQVILQFPIAGYVTQYPYNVTIATFILLALVGEVYLEKKQQENRSNKTSSSTTDPSNPQNSS
jgi:signal peptidase I